MPDQSQVPKTTHKLAEWIKDGSALSQAKEAMYLPKCTHTIFHGVIRIQCIAERQPNGLVLKNAVIEGFHPDLGPMPNTVFVWDELVISNGAIVFPIDKPTENK